MRIMLTAWVSKEINFRCNHSFSRFMHPSGFYRTTASPNKTLRWSLTKKKDCSQDAAQDCIQPIRTMIFNNSIWLIFKAAHSAIHISLKPMWHQITTISIRTLTFETSFIDIEKYLREDCSLNSLHIDTYAELLTP